ncbi:hypothetical protein M2480_001230 [Parabacteroides sp. PFB2-12]|uniref:exo-rhamnogalacturonan lyase family protein n=1 Tax=Parabacteroides sp. PFB2-12 TaxID=2940652 RepID=UPI002473FB5B|nr:DUF6250 domain-containing protein [Parabacteroides sp. PFB2-12]MDH6390257.1 hypothetical protein [Parabacteroides sp. PFB2-12]
MNRLCRFSLTLLIVLFSTHAGAQTITPSGLNAQEFDQYWQIESESPDYRVRFLNDTVEILAPQGLTLWRKEKMSGDITIEYDACIMDEGMSGDRLSDLNCFWMASDPLSSDDIWKRAAWRQGIFNHYYSLQMYYLGYGGNHNTTTRFRRYDGNYEAVEKENKRPVIIEEYTDQEHLLQPNQWYRIQISTSGNKTTYSINGKRLVDFRDPQPHRSGWFGFRTTLARARMTNFRYINHTPDDNQIPLQWIGQTPQSNSPVSFGVPFPKGKIQAGRQFNITTANGIEIPADNWPLAYWPDGSVKWGGFAAVIPPSADSLFLQIDTKERSKDDHDKIRIEESDKQIVIHTGVLSAYFTRQGAHVLDSLVHHQTKVGGEAKLICQTETTTGNITTHTRYESRIKQMRIERAGDIRTTVKIEGVHSDGQREWLPFTLRLYFYAGSERVRLVHSFVYDGDQDSDFIHSLGLSFNIPMREALYNRHILFAGSEEGVWSEPVQPLTGRRVLTLNGDRTLYQQQINGERIPDYDTFDIANQTLIHHWASWDGYRLSQLSPDAFNIRKRVADDRPWIGTFSGDRSQGLAFAGDVSGGLAVCLQDFWQSYPSSIEITGARTSHATLTVWLWSPEGEAMDLRHYDHVAHDLNASYEDVQEGLSTPYGIARTSVITLAAQSGFQGKKALSLLAQELTSPQQLMCTPSYLHRQQAFGVWSLPDRTTPFRTQIEDRLDETIEYYQHAIEQHKWYGLWNYGDLMHAYDAERHSWRYDIGGFAWDNTELASNMWLWYSFLRSGREDIWRMAEAMSRHTGEVDVYHLGEYAGLGSRHNVSHWGCGAKEARISQAAWNRFYYYLTTDERTGDLMSEVTDSDQLLYALDPMRLAQPREQYPSTAPARLRIGPDWLAYAGNWMTEWERTQNTAYRDKIVAGMNSITQLNNGIFTGPNVLGYDPATGIISYEGDPDLQNVGHLKTIMGGFEINNEMMQMIDHPAWNKVWLDHAEYYSPKSKELRGSVFYIPRLTAYAAYIRSDKKLKERAWKELIPDIENGRLPRFESRKILPPETLYPQDENRFMSTNNAATWALDAIYMLEVIPPNQ